MSNHQLITYSGSPGFTGFDYNMTEQTGCFSSFVSRTNSSSVCFYMVSRDADYLSLGNLTAHYIYQCTLTDHSVIHHRYPTSSLRQPSRSRAARWMFEWIFMMGDFQRAPTLIQACVRGHGRRPLSTPTPWRERREKNKSSAEWTSFHRCTFHDGSQAVTKVPR